MEKQEQTRISVVLPAAGSANRMEGINKQLYRLGRYTVIEHSLQAFLKIPEILEIIVVCREEELLLYQEVLLKYSKEVPCKVVVGGATRQDSVFAGITACSSSATLYAIHDGARPMIQPKQIRDCISLCQQYGAAAVGVPVKDTIKIVDDNHKIVETPPRDCTYAVQTPQIFEANLYQKAMAQALREGKNYTDDCQLMEQMGTAVYISEGSYENIKITTPDDIPVIEGIFSSLE